MYADKIASTRPYTNMTGIVLAKFGCEFGYPDTAIKYLSTKYPHKKWDWRKYNISRNDNDLISEIVTSPRRFRCVSEEDNSGVIFDHELFVKYIPIDIIESGSYRVDRHICGEEYIVIDIEKFQLYINRKIMESNIKNKLEKLEDIDAMIKKRCNIQTICQVADML